jgi:hypothetical protein
MNARRHLKDIADLNDADRAALQRLARAWAEHPSPVLFAGAGLSAFHTRSKLGLSARALRWVDLAERWRQEFERDGLKDPPLDPLRLAQLYEQAFGRSRLLDTLEAAVPEDLLELEPTYREIASIPWGAIVTTNYDTFLERAFEGTQLRLLRMIRDPDLTRRRSLTEIPLIKMHGEFAHRDLIIITEDDYNGYRRSRPGIAAKVDQLLIEHPILFVGFSLDDPNVSRILNWVRATVGTLQLPSVSIVHSAPSRPECELWASRGIRLVYCPKSLRLADLLAAFYRERETPTQVEPSTDEKTQRLTRQLIEAIAGSSRSGWEVKARDCLRKLLDRADAGHRHVTAQALKSVHADDWSTVIACLTHEDLTRWMRLLAEEEPFFQHKKDPYGRAAVVIETGLLLFGALSDEERTELAIAWTRKVADDANIPLLRSFLASMRDLRERDLPAAVRASLDIEIRELVFLLGDENELRRELAVPAGEDPFALCRRGADFLLLGETSSARSWYARAHDRARTGDEAYAALRGLWACEGWRGDAGLESERIPEVQRPKSESVLKLRQTAGDEALSKAVYAVKPLEQFLREARALGWPPSAHLNRSGPLEGAAKAIARIQLEAGGPDNIRAAVAWFLRLGEFDKDSLTNDQFDALVSRPDNIAVMRVWLDRTPAGIRQQQSHALFKLRSLDVLTDDEIDTTVRTLVIDPVGVTGDAHLNSAGVERWALLEEEGQRMPVETALRVAGTLPRILALPSFRAAECLKVIQPWLWPLPAERWRDRRELRSLVESLLERCKGPDSLSSWPERQAVLETVSRLANAKLLHAADRNAFRVALDEFLKRPLRDDDHLSAMFSALDALLDLGVKKESLAKRLAAHLNTTDFKTVVNSTSLGQWCWAVRELGPFTTGKLFEDLHDKLLRAASQTLANDRRDRGELSIPVFAWEIALALGTLGSVSDRARKKRSVTAIDALGERYPDALPALLKVGRVAPSALIAAEDRIARAVYNSRHEEERRSATQAVIAWCEFKAEAKAEASDRMWELFIATVAVNPPSSDRARGHLGWFADRGLIPGRYRERVAELALAGTAEGQSWSFRARSAIVLRSVARGTTHQDAARMRLRALLKEPVALLRRVAERALSVAGRARGPSAPNGSPRKRRSARR